MHTREPTSLAPPQDMGQPAPRQPDMAALRSLIGSDLYRVQFGRGTGALVRRYLRDPCFRIVVHYRLARFFYERGSRLGLITCKALLAMARSRVGMDLSVRTRIGSGLYIGHGYGIVIHPDAVIGRNVNISHQVTIGASYRGRRQGAPVIGDHVFIGPGAKIFGAVTIGNNVAIGANSVVLEDVPDNAVVAGLPARVVSFDGAADYVTGTDYEEEPQERPN